MKIKHCYIIVFCFLSSLVYAQSEQVQVIIPTSDSECEYIWRNIGDISFFEKNGYTLSLPKLDFTDKLLQDSRSGKLNETDLALLKKLVADSVYKESDYLKGYEKITEGIPVIEKAILQLRNYKWNWDFFFYPQYKICLTLYGPGGSYDPETGNVLLLTTKEGKFKGYNNSTNTIIHEIIHIGIESSIVNKYNLSHTLKERIVDLFVKTFFYELLPDYRLQDFGDKRIDSYLSGKEDFFSLSEKIQQFIKDNN